VPELYNAMKIRGFLHLYNGEEAVAVGVMRALQPEDAIAFAESGTWEPVEDLTRFVYTE
jgi:TPP-dependent pyruvate/acetoin dehydrogenase alpha subunit